MTLLSVFLLAVHLVAMNVASAAPLVCVWLYWRGRRGDEAAFRAGRELARMALAAFMIGVGVGAAQLGMAWVRADQGYFDALGRFPASAFLYAVGELVFSAACLAVYSVTWQRWRGRPWLHSLIAVLTATNLLYHFPPLMIVLGQLAQRPEFVSDATITRNVFRPLMVRPEILSQSMHFTVASVAVAGFALMHVAQRQRREGTAEAGASRLICAGARIALASSVAQLAVGAWVLVELPIRVRNSLTGDDLRATSLFCVAMLLTFAVLHTLGRIALGETSDRTVRRSGALLLAAVILMSAITQTTRSNADHAVVTVPVAG